jgi:hypothetical protein
MSDVTWILPGTKKPLHLFDRASRDGFDRERCPSSVQPRD